MCGSLPGKNYNLLFERAADQYGFVTAKDARELDIHEKRLAEMRARGVLERRARGLYRFPAIPPTGYEQLMEATLWPRRARGILSHATALDVHDLCDVNPAKIDITVPAGYRVNRDVPAVYAIHHRDLEPTEVTLYEGIPIVTPLRAIKDGIEVDLGPHLLEQAIETARRRGRIRKRDLPELEQLLGRPLGASA